MDSWQLKQILKLYIYFIVKTTSSVKLFEDFEVTLQKFHNGWKKYYETLIRACNKVVCQLVYKGKKFVFLKDPLYLINQ